jgi:hypothetical protein
MVIKMGEACCTHGRDKRRIKIFVEKSEGKRPLGRHRHKWNDIIIHLKLVGYVSADWSKMVKSENTSGCNSEL